MYQEILIPGLLFALATSHVLARNSKIVQSTLPNFKTDDFTSVAECGCTLFQLQMSAPNRKLRDVTSTKEQQMLDEVDQRKLSQKLLEVEEEIVTLKKQLKSQQELQLQVEVNVRKEVMRDNVDYARLNEKLTTENADLKQQIKQTNSCKEEVLTELKTSNKEAADQITSLIKSTSLQSNSKINDKMHRLDENVIKVSNVLSQLFTKLDSQEAKLNSHKDLLINIQQQLSQHAIKMDSKLENYNALVEKIEKLPCEITGLKTTTINGKRYFFSFEQPRMTWNEADEFCKSHHMHLVSVETQEEWLAISSECKRLTEFIPHHIWSSGKYDSSKQLWKWSSDNSKITYFYTKISNGNNNCLAFIEANWNSWPCSEERPFICESQC